VRSFSANSTRNSLKSGCPVAAKKRKAPAAPAATMPPPVDTMHLRAAEVFTLLLWGVNPHINREETFEILYEALVDGLSAEKAVAYGQAIALTAANCSQPEGH